MCGAVIEVNESGDSGECQNDKEVVVVSESAIVVVVDEDKMNGANKTATAVADDAPIDSPEAEQAFVELCQSIESNDAKLTLVDLPIPPRLTL
jgi:hypothetical protein